MDEREDRLVKAARRLLQDGRIMSIEKSPDLITSQFIVEVRSALVAYEPPF